MGFTFEFLYSEYVEQGKSLRAIAQATGYSRQTILTECRRLGIPTRPRSLPQPKIPDLDAFKFSEAERKEYMKFFEFYRARWPQTIVEAFYGGWQFHKRYLWDLEQAKQEANDANQ